MMEWIKAWQQQRGMTVVAVLHDLNLAAMYCDRLLLLHNGKIAGMGSPTELLSSELILQVYGTEPILVDHPVHRIPQLLLRKGGTNHDDQSK